MTTTGLCTKCGSIQEAFHSVNVGGTPGWFCSKCTAPIILDPKGFNEAKKNDAEKIRLELLSVTAMEEIGKVLTFGAKKYDAHNWRKGMAWSRLLGAALRHLTAYMRGEDLDPETGLSHLAHAGCCIMFLLEYQKSGLGTDDRFKEVPHP